VAKMNEQQLIMFKAEQLNSEALKQELLFFLDYLLMKQDSQKNKSGKKVPQFGCAKGMFKMSDDFDEPLDDFKDYMP
jgi:Protein of unknown function (DUF2281)